MPLFKQPLLHFLLLGALVFIAANWLDQSQEDELLASQASFLEFLQYRNKGAGSSSVEQLLNDLTDAQKQVLWSKHLEEEVLYREALKLGLDKKDYVIKQRLIQKMGYLLETSDTQVAPFSQVELNAYFQRNRERYYVPATVTFSHVFIGSSQVDGNEMAKKLQQQLNQQRVLFEQASRFGDRFLYYTNYINRDMEFIASHFGHNFASQVFTLRPAEQQWQGPLVSDHGWHLVLLAQSNRGFTPTLEAIADRVRRDTLIETKQRQRDERVQKLIKRHQRVMPDLTVAR